MAVVYKAWSLMSDGDLCSLPPTHILTYITTHPYPCLQESETRLGAIMHRSITGKATYISMYANHDKMYVLAYSMTNFQTHFCFL